MSSILNTTAAIIVLCLAAMDSLHARAANYHDYHPWSRHGDGALGNSHPGYASPVFSHWHYYVDPVSDKRRR